MEKKFRKSLFLFRRDLRLEDNTGLIFALKSSEVVIAAFIFTPEQIERNPFRSDHCLKFMIESLKDLENQLKKKGGKLFFFKGKPEEKDKSSFPKPTVGNELIGGSQNSQKVRFFWQIWKPERFSSRRILYTSLSLSEIHRLLRSRSLCGNLP